MNLMAGLPEETGLPTHGLWRIDQTRRLQMIDIPKDFSIRRARCGLKNRHIDIGLLVSDRQRADHGIIHHQ